MPIDTSIYSAAMPRSKSIFDYQNELQQQDLGRQSLQQNALAIQGSRQKLAEGEAQAGERASLRNALQGGLDPTTPDGRNKLYQIAPTMAPGILKTMQDQMTSQALAAKDNAQARHLGSQADGEDFKNRRAKANQAIVDIADLSNPADALASLDRHLAAGDIDQDKYAAVRQTIPQDPSQFPQWRKNMVISIMDAKDKLTALTPDVVMQNTGGSIVPVNKNANAGPIGAIAGAAPVAVTQSPDSVAQNATSRANNRDTIAKDLQVAGVAPGGGLDDNAERTAKAIASGQLPAPTGMALLNPKNQRILGRVMEINPEYDSTTVDAKKKAARDFTSGTLGNAMRSFNVAGQHLDQLGTLVDALDNGNMQIVNKIGNAYREQTGSAAPTNFDAAKDVVSKEVVKAIVAGGGGVSERQELSELMSKAKSPAQLKGVIQQYRNLMAAQHDALLRQRRAAGLSDSTLPNYAEPSGNPGGAAKSPTANAKGWPLHIDANGNKAYVSPDGKQFEEVK